MKGQHPGEGRANVNLKTFHNPEMSQISDLSLHQFRMAVFLVETGFLKQVWSYSTTVPKWPIREYFEFINIPAGRRRDKRPVNANRAGLSCRPADRVSRKACGHHGRVQGFQPGDLSKTRGLTNSPSPATFRPIRLFPSMSITPSCHENLFGNLNVGRAARRAGQNIPRA